MENVLGQTAVVDVMGPIAIMGNVQGRIAVAVRGLIAMEGGNVVAKGQIALDVSGWIVLVLGYLVALALDHFAAYTSCSIAIVQVQLALAEGQIVVVVTEMDVHVVEGVAEERRLICNNLLYDRMFDDNNMWIRRDYDHFYYYNSNLTQSRQLQQQTISLTSTPTSTTSSSSPISTASSLPDLIFWYIYTFNDNIYSYKYEWFADNGRLNCSTATPKDYMSGISANTTEEEPTYHYPFSYTAMGDLTLDYPGFFNCQFITQYNGNSEDDALYGSAT
ncbi:hypothetical protein BDZ45DRAFT_812292 [Acephala macrosclerotiorum]|nr:hypothetical protein BDZ45DRAFT_812292 [Acephala macrosclerotiorum]